MRGIGSGRSKLVAQRVQGALPLSELTPTRIAGARDRVGDHAHQRRPHGTRQSATLSAARDGGALPRDAVLHMYSRGRRLGLVRRQSCTQGAQAKAAPRSCSLSGRSRTRAAASRVPRVRQPHPLSRSSHGDRDRNAQERDPAPAWKQIDLDRGLITLEETKNGERRQLPLLGHAADIMKSWAEPPHSEAGYVFPGEVPGAPRDIAKAWSTATAHAELTDFRFHDLRHTTASYLAMRGASLLEIGEVLGHKSPQSTRRYSHLSVSHTRKVLGGMVAEAFSEPVVSGRQPGSEPN